MSQANPDGKQSPTLLQEFSWHLNPIQVQKDQTMRFVEWFFIYLSQQLRNYFVFSWTVLMICQLLSIRNQLNNLSQLHVVIHLLDES
jgi:hypothetical protein